MVMKEQFLGRNFRILSVASTVIFNQTEFAICLMASSAGVGS